MKKYLVLFLFAALLLGSYELEAQSTYSVSYYRTGKTYRLNDLVSLNGAIYKAQVATTNAPPNSDWIDITASGGGSTGNIANGTVVGNMTYWDGVQWQETPAITTDLTDIYVLNDLIVTGNITGANLSNTNTGDQTNLSDFTGTKAELNAAITDGDVLYVGDLTAEIDPVFVAEESDILKVDEAKLITAQQTFDGSGAIPLGNYTTAEIDVVGNLALVNRRWAVDFLQGGGAEVDPVFAAWLATPVFTTPVTGVDGVAATDLITKQQLDGIQGETAIGRYDEGNGDTFYPVGSDRTNKGNGGIGALDMSSADGAGGYGTTNGALGELSIAFGYNVKTQGYGSFILGQDSDIPSSGSYAFNVGTDNSIGGYSGFGVGTFLTNTTNYGIQVGHSIDFTSGGLNVGVGFALSETTALSDKVALFGQANKEPINSEGFASNNIGAIFGSGDITGNGSTKFVRVTPRNSIVLFRDALAGLVNLEESTLANLQTWDDTFPHAAATVEYVQDAVSNAGGIGGSITVGQIAIGNATANTIIGTPTLTFNAGTLAVLGGASFLAQVQAAGYTIPTGTSDDVLLGDGTTTSLAGIGVGNNGFTGADEGSGFTHYSADDNRTNKVVGGFRALDISGYGAEAGPATHPVGAEGTFSFAQGINNKASGYGSVAFGEGSISGGSYSFINGIYNTATGYGSFTSGARNQSTGNYSQLIGVSNWDEGDTNFMIGTALRGGGGYETTILGTANVTPSTYLAGGGGLSGERIALIVGTGTTQGDINTNPNGQTPLVQADGFRVFRSGLVTAPSQTTALINANTDALITKAYADATYAGGGDVSIVKFVDNTGVLTDNIITMNGNRFMHNYGTTAIDWEKNFFLGENTGNFTLTGNTNGFVGNTAGYSLTTGAENYGFGNETLGLTTTGSMNTAFGSAALYSNVDGIRNLGFGRQAGVWVTSGDNNTFLGSTAGFAQGAGGNLTSIDEAVLIGSFADGTQGSTNEIAIGYQVIGKGSNTIQLGNENIEKFYVGGNYTSPAYWEDGGDLSGQSNSKARPFSGGFDMEVDVIAAFGGGTDKFRFANSSSDADERVGVQFFQGSNGETLAMRFETDNADDDGAQLWLGFDYWDMNGARIENAYLDVDTDASSISGNLPISAMGETRFVTSATAKTLSILDTFTLREGATISIVQQGTGALTIAVTGTATLNGVTAGSLTLTGQYSAVQIIQPVNESDDWIAIGDFTMN